MSTEKWILLGAGFGLAGIAALATPALLRWRRARYFRRAHRLFAMRREWLEAEFLSAASRTGLPRGLVWVNCDFENNETLARDRKTGELTAFVGMTVSFEAIEGGPMEHVEAVGNLRAATAVFRFLDDHWTTDGQAFFNVNPREAIARFEREVECVD